MKTDLLKRIDARIQSQFRMHGDDSILPLGTGDSDLSLLIEAKAEIERLTRSKCAVEYADRLGIYAIPCHHGPTIYWRPRTAKGYDPELGWQNESEPTIYGWKSWADAVVALGDYITQQGDTDAKS